MFELPTKRGPAPARNNEDDGSYNLRGCSRDEAPPLWKGSGSDRWEILRSIGERRGSFAPCDVRAAGNYDSRRSFDYGHKIDRWARFHDSRHDPDRDERRKVCI